MDHKEEYSTKYIADVLASVKTIAMVGASPDPTKFSYGVLRVLHEQGFKMFPINNKPEIKEIRGIKVFPSLDAVDQPIDMVQVFRRADALYGVAEEAINIGAKVLWGQIGVFNEDAASLAEDAGLQVVMNRVTKMELFRPFWKPKLGLGI